MQPRLRSEHSPLLALTFERQGSTTAAPPGAPQFALRGRRVRRRGHRPRCVEAVAAGWAVEAQFVAAGTDAGRPRRSECTSWPPSVLERVASTESPQPRPGRRAHAPATLPTCVGEPSCSSRIGSPTPATLGTIIRSAEAAGADAVVLTPGLGRSVQPEGRAGDRPDRCSASPSSTSTLDSLSAARLRTSARRRTEGDRYTDADLPRPDRASSSATRRTASPTTPRSTSGSRSRTPARAESLNVAMAATVAGI